jgi:hypothetical protein
VHENLSRKSSFISESSGRSMEDPPPNRVLVKRRSMSIAGNLTISE